MPISISLLAAATLAVAAPNAAPSTAAAPAASAAAHQVGARAFAPAVASQSAQSGVSHAVAQPAWRTVRTDTIGNLLLTTQTLNGRVRFMAHGLKGAAATVTTADFPPDSVKAWAASAAELASTAAPRMGDIRGLDAALTLTVTTAAGQTAYGFYVGDATTDKQVALALTKENALKLTAAVNGALDSLSP
jgi:hypothetical protein